MSETDEINKNTENIEIEYIKTHPDKLFLYIWDNKTPFNWNGKTYEPTRHWVTTWPGTVVGRAYYIGPEYRNNMGDKRINIHVEIDDVWYSGIYFISAGDYCRIKKIKKPFWAIKADKIFEETIKMIEYYKYYQTYIILGSKPGIEKMEKILETEKNYNIDKIKSDYIITGPNKFKKMSNNYEHCGFCRSIVHHAIRTKKVLVLSPEDHITFKDYHAVGCIKS